VGTSLAHPAEPKLAQGGSKQGSSKQGSDQQAATAVWFIRDQSEAGPVTRAATLVVQWARTYPRAVDAIVAIGLFALGVYSTRLTQIAFVDAINLAEKIRPGAEAAVKLGGKAAVGGKEALRLLEQEPHLPRVGWLYFLGALSTLPLIFRRRFPGVVHALIFSGFVALLWVFPLDVQIASLTAWVSTYTFAAYGKANARVRNWALSITGLILVLLLTGVVKNHEFNPEPLVFRQAFFYMLLSVVLYGAP
jgi:hypothetical protein